MIDFIQSETKKMMYKCCERYATSNAKSIDDIQLILGLNVTDEKEPNKYTICESYLPKKELSIMEVLGVKIDFLAYSKLAPPFILKSLIRFAKDNQVDYEKICIMCVPTRNEKNKPDILLALYNGMEYIETITFSDLFREEDFEMPV
jgi:hypothetical protein